MEQVGIVGTGAMGSALLHRLRVAEVPATTYDLDPAAVLAARAEGAAIAGSAADVARASTVIDVVVRTDDEILEAVLGEGGVLEGAAPGSLVLLHSTSLPQTTKRVAEAAGARGVHVIDACMLGVPEVVRAGKLRFVVGGPKELFERAQPHLQHMAQTVLHVGDLGAGNVVKLAHNLLMGAETLVLHETLLIGEAGGIPYPKLLGILGELAGESDTRFQNWQRTFDPSGTDPTPHAGHNTIPKDVPLAGEVARLYGVPAPIIRELAASALRVSGLSPSRRD
ncbi:MAG TPA: NAD(P)-dependent oxidoreductase [Chloroflexota bacterium]|jgi:3-hydroxyisobutyrate dehydrogenase-like beta-hydroxyacid dehydrogenase